MKVVAALIVVVCLLSGCNNGQNDIKQAMDLRKHILESQGCTFQATVTADYDKTIYTFQMDCTIDSNGLLQFTVTDPDTISGITGNISKVQSSLTFDDKVLAFPLLSEGLPTPVSGPWLFINALRSGYLTGCSNDEGKLAIYLNDSYEENPLHLQIHTDEKCCPIYAEVIWQDRRVLSMDIRGFIIL